MLLGRSELHKESGCSVKWFPRVGLFWTVAEKTLSVVLRSHCLTCFSILNYSERWTDNCFGLVFFSIANAGAHSCLLPLSCRFALLSALPPQSHTDTHTHTQNYVTSHHVVCLATGSCLVWTWCLSEFELGQWFLFFFSLFEYEVICVLPLDHIKSRDELKTISKWE